MVGNGDGEHVNASKEDPTPKKTQIRTQRNAAQSALKKKIVISRCNSPVP